MREPLIILDNAHGNNVKGKRSPELDDGSIFYEYQWSRMFNKKLKHVLQHLGYTVEYNNDSDIEIGLTQRVRVANQIIQEAKQFKSLLISTHCNAFGTDWNTARGYEIYTSPGQDESDRFADILTKQLKEVFNGFIKFREDYSDGDTDKEAQFTVIAGNKHTTPNYPGVLTENFFMTNKDDIKLLQDEETIDKLLTAHVAAIIKYSNSK